MTPPPPGKPAAPVKSTTEADRSDPKLATKPIDESKLLTKVTKPSGTTPSEKPTATATTPATENNQSVTHANNASSVTKPTDKSVNQSPTTQKLSGETNKAATTTPDVLSQVFGGESSASPTEPVLADKSAVKSDKSQTKGVTQSAGREASGTKRVDSSTMPQTKPTQSAPANEPTDPAKPPKVQKTALPETKVVKTPKYTESPEAGNALTGKIATALEGGKAMDAQPAGDKAQDTAAATGAGLSRGEAVRQRYLAGRDRNLPPEPALSESMTTSGSESAQQPLTDIDKIRLKYKRGIKFVQNDWDEQQQATGDTEQLEESDQSSQDVGHYSEFLPDREIVVYQTSGRADPFMPLIEEATTSAGGGELPDVETLRLVGILQDKKASRALFEDYNGFSFILRTGDRVKNGFVLSIEDTRVLFQIRQYGWNRQIAVDLESEK
jgi:hypothetical protein